MGDLLIAPLLCVWASPRRLSRRPIRWLEGALLGTALVTLSMVIFGRMLPSRAFQLVRGTYAIAPVDLGGSPIRAARNDRRAGAGGDGRHRRLRVARIAVHRGHPARTIADDPSYMAVTAVSMLTLAAALVERRAAIGVRDEFISIASHELKTPLTALKLRIESATRAGSRRAGTTQEYGEARLAKALGAATVTTDRLVSLVDNLLDVSRVHSASLVLHAEPLALNQLRSGRRGAGP